ncbi:Uncharacterised protein [Amycolatopsis camponoti]|uniref:Uncharacterized protein n=1 Tax=Amycolatopsis camponoti TaxID=2606593 RepID=A0A6I8LMK7_9PSEU|nr:Uncharacterised protein [Amycolatopsis camponoti]
MSNASKSRTMASLGPESIAGPGFAAGTALALSNEFGPLV